MISTLDLGIFPGRKVSYIRQAELSECGLACLAMVAGYHGYDISLGALRRTFSPSTRGVTLGSLIGTADLMGLASRAVRVDLSELGALALPAVLHWDLNHFVVLEAVSGPKALIHNPAESSRWLSLSELSRHFTGIALEIEPTIHFHAGDYRQRLKLSSMWSRVRGLKRAILQTIVLSLVVQTFTLVSPYYLQLAIDSALPELSVSLLSVLALGFGLLTVLNGIALMLRASVLLAVGSSFGHGLSSNVARKLFRLPVDWFTRRHTGDVLSRFQSVGPIRRMLAEDAPATLVDGVLAILTLCLMIVYSPTLSLVTVIALSLLTLARVILFQSQRKAQDEVLVATGREQSVLIESVHGIRALRLAGREALRHALWQSRMTDAVNGSVRSQRLSNWQSTLQNTLFALESVVSVWLAVGMVIRGGFSVGMVFAFLAYKTQFLTAASSLITKASDFKMLSLHLERLSDIVLTDDDVSFLSARETDSELSGDIELRNVYYRHSAADPFVLRGANLSLVAGESVAITGPSGGGKTTLLMILLGLIEPTKGDLYVDGLSLQSFGYRSYHRQVSAVLQDDILFSGSLIDNISLFEENADRAWAQEVARVAAIHDDIEAMAMGYETLVGEMGTTLSGGQRQRVFLARALYRRPKVLVIDEGTSHLDEAREREVNDAIAAMGITRVFVAHRRETIASAKRVFVLNDGVLTERLT